MQVCYTKGNVFYSLKGPLPPLYNLDTPWVHVRYSWVLRHTLGTLGHCFFKNPNFFILHFEKCTTMALAGEANRVRAEKFTGDLDVMTVLLDRFVVVFRVHNKHHRCRVTALRVPNPRKSRSCTRFAVNAMGRLHSCCSRW